MRQRLAVSLVFVVVCLVPGVGRGQTVYSDGDSHTVSGSSGPIELKSGGTTLNVEPGATVSGSPAVQFGAAIVSDDIGTTINLQGGVISAVTQVHGYGGTAIQTDGFLSAFDGVVTGGSGIAGGTALWSVVARHRGWDFPGRCGRRWRGEYRDCFVRDFAGRWWFVSGGRCRRGRFELGSCDVHGGPG